ncbi:MAG: mandelate racemase/muconate lactonizing enzyme family protein [Chitinivibrionales bacterium]|nr:mandelate racemase/muconate lactonizing enzyme family protein [Chitinivibrionales bacterium]
MKITRIETHTRNPLSFVKVFADDGAEGIGQIAPYNADIAATVLHRQVAGHFLGRDPGELEALCDRVIDANLKFPWSYVCRALGGIDTAVWDLRGKRAGKSVCELLGGTPRAFPVYGSSMSRRIAPNDEAARVSRLAQENGFGAFKIRVGQTAGHDLDAWPGRTEALVPAVRAALADDVRLLVDANSCYTPRKAIEVGRMLVDNGVCHFEEPCPWWELEWTAQVTAARLGLDITGGEQDVDLAQWRRMIGMHAVDIVQPDICYVGGLTRALAVARMAHEAGMRCIPHSANLSLVTVFSAHMMGAIPNAGPYVEYSIEDVPWTNGLFEPALDVHDGCLTIPNGPGWGVKIDPAWFDGAEVQVSSLDDRA